MQVIFESPDPSAEELRSLAMPRIRLAMRRLGWLVRIARVRFSGVENAHGGIDKRCEVELSTGDSEPVVIVSVARDWLAALHSALGRASKALLHRWQREQRIPRLAAVAGA